MQHPVKINNGDLEIMELFCQKQNLNYYAMVFDCEISLKNKHLVYFFIKTELKKKNNFNNLS